MTRLLPAILAVVSLVAAVTHSIPVRAAFPDQPIRIVIPSIGTVSSSGGSGRETSNNRAGSALAGRPSSSPS